MTKRFKFEYFFVFNEESTPIGKRKEVIKKFVEKLAESKLVNHRYGIDVKNEITYDVDLNIPDMFDPQGTWHIEFTTDIPNAADPIQVMMWFHDLVLKPLPEYTEMVQMGGGAHPMPKYEILSKEEIKENQKKSKLEAKEMNRKYFNKKPMREFKKQMDRLYEEKFGSDINVMELGKGNAFKVIYGK